MEEVWRTVPGFDGYYEASNYGKVKSLDRVTKWGRATYIRKGRILKESIDKHGYHRVSLFVNGQPFYYRVNVLVYTAFIGPVPDGMQVNHIDENKDNNCVWNLNLMSPKDNSNWGTRNRRISIKRGKTVEQYTTGGKLVNTFHSTREAGRVLNINSSHIIQVCNGERHTAGGYRWRYKTD